jgi:hypothetical protein
MPLAAATFMQEKTNIQFIAYNKLMSNFYSRESLSE